MIITKDGSSTLFVPALNETYHSIHGAVQESCHVFLKKGLKFLNKRKFKVLEVGFGTGLNACLTMEYAHKNHVQVTYHSVEKHPLTFQEIGLLNFQRFLKHESTFKNITAAAWEQEVCISQKFKMKKIKGDLLKTHLEKNFNVIFFDAFAPDKQPKMWTEEVFLKMYNSLAYNGCLVTYCCKGSVKRSMQAVGFTIEKVDGPPGKREMLRAIKK